MPNCNKENMRALVSALYSGVYPQGREQLRVEQPDGTWCYCCLGVACDLMAARGLGDWDGVTFRDGYGHSSDVNLTPGGLKFLGLDSAHDMAAGLILSSAHDMAAGLILSDDPDQDHGTGAVLNDAGASFDEIAAAIEDYYQLGETS